MGVRNVRGGLTAVAVPELTRAALWHALKARRCYATTGARILLSLTAGHSSMGDETAVQLESGKGLPAFNVHVIGTAGIEAIDFFRDDQLLQRIEPTNATAALSNRIRVAWRGASAPGNWERARMSWDGELRIEGARIESAHDWAMDTPDEGITAVEGQRVAWTSVTAGDWDGIVLQLDRPANAMLIFATEPMNVRCNLASLDGPAWTQELESPQRVLEVKRLPMAEPAREVHHAFTDAAPVLGRHAYWIRVRQTDGAYAWSTPIFFDITGTLA
jgi:hypothetical protein